MPGQQFLHVRIRLCDAPRIGQAVKPDPVLVLSGAKEIPDWTLVAPLLSPHPAESLHVVGMHRRSITRITTDTIGR